MTRARQARVRSHPEPGLTRVAASLWSVAPAEQESLAGRLAAAGLRRWHWDHSDGTIGARGGFTPQDAARINTLTHLPAEAHLMVAEPGPVVQEWTAVCDTVIVHVEARGYEQAIESILSAGCTAAVAISPDTPLSTLANLPDNVGALVMSVAPGQAGSVFRTETLARLRALRGRELLGVDGSVTADRAAACLSNGASWIVSGTDLCTAHDPAGWIRRVEGRRFAR